MTLADLNFTFDTSGLDNLKSLIKNSLDIDDFIEKTPEIIVDDLEKIVEFFSNNFNTNLENFANDVKTYFDQQAINLKNDIEESLALDPNTLYNIHVTEAEHALNSDKLEGKSFNEVVSYIVSNYISPATVANALKFNGKTYSEVLNDIKLNLKVNNAANADKFNNMTYTDVKNDIISSIDLGDSIDLDLIKNKVENQWVAYKAKDTEAFAGNDKNTWLNSLIPSVKVNNAVDSDKLQGYTFSDIIDSVNTIVQNQLSNFPTTDTFKNSVKNIKVNNAVNADKASNSLKLNGYSFSSLIDYIENNVTVSKADNADNFADLSKDEWQSYIQNQVNSLKNNLTSGTVVPAKAEEVLKINGIEVSNFDNHIKSIVDEEYDNLTGEINAKYFNGYDFDNFISYIEENVKVNEAVSADSATSATNATYATSAEKVGGKYYYEIEDEAKELTLEYLDSHPLSKLDFDIANSESFNTNFSLLAIFNYLHPVDKIEVLPDISSLNYGSAKQVFTYDEQENITEIKYFTSSDLLTFEDTGSKVYNSAYVNQHEKFTYNEDGNITKIEKDIYLPISYNEKSYVKITYVQTLTYDEDGNITKIETSTPTITGIDSLLTS